MAKTFEKWWEKLVSKVQKELKTTPLDAKQKKEVLAKFENKRTIFKKSAPSQRQNTFSEQFGLSLGNVISSKKREELSEGFVNFFKTIEVWIEENSYERF